MSEVQHTPGPWRVGNTDPLLFGRPQGNGSEPLGFVYGPAFPERSEVGQRAMANARLIAAAPDLLEALQYARRFLKAQDHDVAFVDAAIAKATGA